MHVRRAGQLVARPLNCGVMRPFSLLALLVGPLAWVGTARAADSVILGRAVSNTYLPGIEGACGPLSADELCMNVWFVWEISAKRTVTGAPISGRVRAARSQHTTFVRSYMRRNRLFLLRPIEDPEQRRLLQADFHLVDMSADNCLEVEPRGLNAQDPGVTHQHTERGDVYCFAVDDKGG